MCSIWKSSNRLFAPTTSLYIDGLFCRQSTASMYPLRSIFERVRLVQCQPFLPNRKLTNIAHAHHSCLMRVFAAVQFPQVWHGFRLLFGKATLLYSIYSMRSSLSVTLEKMIETKVPSTTTDSSKKHIVYILSNLLSNRYHNERMLAQNSEPTIRNLHKTAW